MNKIIATAVAAFVVGSVSTGVLLAQAQPVAPVGGPPGASAGGPTGTSAGGPLGASAATDGAGADRGPGRGQGWDRGPGWRGAGMDHRAMGPWAERMHDRGAHHRGFRRLFALIDRPEDRKLTPPDVQKIAEAFLLWNGNHTWKVINVKPDGDVIAFDIATTDGSVIAHYAMDPVTGRPSRRG